jgi:hypothetical protein
MKRPPWLVLSLSLNLLLLGVVAWAAQTREPVPDPTSLNRQITNRIVRTAFATNESSAEIIEVSAPFHWSQIESTDYRVYIANLREVGCPEPTIHDIIEADVNDLFCMQVKDIVDSVTGYFWNLVIDPRRMETLFQDKVRKLESLRHEQEYLMKELFDGNDPTTKALKAQQRWEAIGNLKWQFDFLPQEKVVAIQDAFDHRLAAYAQYAQQGANASQEEVQRKYKELDAAHEREIRDLLTPEEFEEYQLRTSDKTNVRYELADMNVSEDEVRAIARAKMKPGSADAIKELLGPDRYAEYQRATDWKYLQALRVTDRFDLPAATAVQVYQMHLQVEAQAKSVRADANRSADERQEILKAMQAETERALSETLGPNVFKTYHRYGGAWITDLAVTKQ